MIDSDLYEQLAKRKKSRPNLENKKNVVFHHDNVKPCTLLATRQKWRESEWEILMQVPYTPNFGPSNYYLLRPLRKPLNH